jgi:hypothetical protein
MLVPEMQPITVVPLRAGVKPGLQTHAVVFQSYVALSVQLICAAVHQQQQQGQGQGQIVEGGYVLATSVQCMLVATAIRLSLSMSIRPIALLSSYYKQAKEVDTEGCSWLTQPVELVTWWVNLSDSLRLAGYGCGPQAVTAAATANALRRLLLKGWLGSRTSYSSRPLPQ